MGFFMSTELISEVILKIFFDLAVILFSTKLLGMLCKKIGLPQVVGMVIAGLLIGPSILGLFFDGFGIISPLKDDVILLENGGSTSLEFSILKSLSQIGVLMILFSSGLETNFADLKKSGFKSTILAISGVAIPFCLGLILTILYLGGFEKISTNTDLFMNCLLVATIMTATSVGITVETLRELGKLSSEIGTTIISAAVIDDVLGIIVLSIVTSVKNGGSVWLTILKCVLFFVFAILFGIILRMIFKHITNVHPHTRRESIFAIAMCLLYGYIAEKFFGVASITGGYMAGLMLSGLADSEYVEKRVLELGYLIFSPIFFAFIGISADFSNFSLSALWFGVLFTILAISGKLLAGLLTGKLFKHNIKESMQLGSGMIARGEVALAVYGTGASMIAEGGVDPIVAVILLILVSSVLCPIFLKIFFKDNKNNDTSLNQNNTSLNQSVQGE